MVVSGTVIDGTTNQPVNGASVTAEEWSVVTNEDGYFALKSESPLTTIVVSHVGYRSQRVSLDGQPAEGLKIRLSPTTIQLHEVVVMADNARDLVMKAISKIPSNYSKQPELYRCALQKFNVAPEECVFIDDVTANIEAALNAGMQGIVFHDDIAELREKLYRLGIDVEPA